MTNRKFDYKGQVIVLLAILYWTVFSVRAQDMTIKNQSMFIQTGTLLHIENGSLETDGTGYLSNNGDVYIKNHLTISQGTVLNNSTFNIDGNLSVSDTFTNNSNIYLSGNYVVNGAGKTTAGGTFWLQGSGSTNFIPSAGGDVFTNLNLAKGVSSATVTLSGKARVTNALNCNMGKFLTELSVADSLIMEANCIGGGNDMSFVQGPLYGHLNGSSPHVFPIGRDTKYRPISFSSYVGTGALVKGQVISGLAPGTPGAGIADLNPTRYWETQKVYGNITSLNFKGTWGSDDNVTATSEVRLGYSETPTGTYNSVGVSAVAGSPFAGVITSNSINRLGYFSLGKNVGNQVDLTVFLQGPYSIADDTMRCKLNGVLATNQLLDSMFHYNGVTPVFIPGGEIVMTPGYNVPPRAVDVVKLVLRDSNTPSYTLIDSTYAWLLSDGTLTDFSEPGTLPKFPKAADGDYFVVIYHRNHLPIMTGTAIGVSTSPSMFDLSDINNVHEQGAIIKNGRAMMFAGNAIDDFPNGDAYEVNASDLNAVGEVNGNIEAKYDKRDINLDSNVNGTDYNVVSVGQDELYYTTVP